MGRKVIIVLLSLLMISLSSIMYDFINANGNEYYLNTIIVDINGNGDFSSIQNAIDASTSGDIIYIWDGIYYEHISIDKSITLIGNGTDNTIIDGNGNGICMSIQSNNVHFNNISIVNQGSESVSTYCAVITQSINIDFLNCNFSESSNGLYITNTNSIKVFNSNFNNNFAHINFDSLSNGIIVENCNFYNNQFSVIYAYGNSYVMDNSTLINTYIKTTIGPYLETYDIDTSNTINNKIIRFYKNINSFNIPKNSSQIFLVNCGDVNINNWGIHLTPQHT